MAKRRRSRPETRIRLLSIDPRCAYCERELTFENATIDHVTPRSKGGSNHRSNSVLSCETCNRIKAGRTAEEWAEWLSRLLDGVRRVLALKSESPITKGTPCKPTLSK